MRAVLTCLSKAFDCIDHNLLIAKLNAYGFEKQSINFIYSYLTKRKQRTKVDSAVSSFASRLVLGPLWFDIHIYIQYTYMFFATPANIDFAGYADDNTPYAYSSNIKNVLDNLQRALEKMFYWLSTNKLVANAGKWHLLASFKMPVDIQTSNTEWGNLEWGSWMRQDLILIFTWIKCAITWTKKTKYSHECFHNISVFWLSYCLDVP